jgi:phosphate-selective porin OprO and OprP
VYGRILLRPFARSPELGALGIGMGASAGIRDGTTDDTSLSSYKTPGQLKLFSYAASKDEPTQTAFAKGWHTRLNPHLYYYYRGLGLLAEMVQSRQEVHRDSYIGKLIHRGWHVTLSYVFGGSNGYDGAIADHPWDPAAGHFGALEIVARYGRLALDSRTFPTFAEGWKSARGGTSVGVTLNWVLGRLFRVVLGLERTQFEAGAGTADAVQNRPSEYVMVTRLTLSL